MNDKQKLFADNYIKMNRNPQKAAISAGYSAHTAAVQASQMLKDQEIRDYIDKEAEKIYKRNHIKIDEAISILTDIGRVTKKDLVDANGDFIPIHQLPDYVAHAIEEVEYQTVYVWDELTEQRIPTQAIKRIKISGKQSALDKALKHLGGYKIDNEQKKPEPIMLTINPLNAQTVDNAQD